MYFLQQLQEHEIKGIFFIFSLKAGSEVEFLISSGTFFQSWLALYAMLSKPNGFCSGILKFKYVNISQIVGIFCKFKDVTHGFVCAYLYPCILTSSGSCVFACIIASSHPYTLSFMCTCWYPHILVSSALCVLASMLTSSGQCVFNTNE